MAAAPRLGIRARLALLVVATTAPFVVLSVLRARRDGRDHQADRLLERVTLATGRISEAVRGIRTSLGTIAAAVDPVPSARARNEAVLQRARDEIPLGVGHVFVVDTLGRIIASSRGDDEPIGIDVSDRDYFRIAKASRGFAIGRPVQLRPDGRWGATFARPIERDGRVAGVIGISVYLSSLKGLVDLGPLPDGSVATIKDTSGVVLYRSLDAERWIGANIRGQPGVEVAIAERRGVDEQPWLDGRLRLSAYDMIGGTPWQLSAGVLPDAYLGDVREEVVRDLLVIGIVTLLALLGGMIIGGRIVGPVRELAADAEALAAGQSERRTYVTTTSEVGTLARAFNAMADRIGERTRALESSERRARAYFELSPVPMWVIDVRRSTVVEANEAAAALYGWSRDELRGMSLFDIRVTEEHGRLQEELAVLPSEPSFLGRVRHRRRDGRVIVVELTSMVTEVEGRPARLTALTDVTTRVATERALAESQEALRQSQKMEAIGRFAGGIAHDFNNILTGILGHCDLALEDLPPGSPAHDEVEAVRVSAERAGALTRQILAFGRRQVVQPEPLDLSRTVGELDRMLRRVVEERIVLETRLSTNGDRVLADRAQIEQVVLNLAVNARDAMPAGGTLAIETSAEVLDGPAAQRLGVPPGRYVRLRVQDTGDGIDDEVLPRIFEPFFTTKEAGRGTGLGLSTVYGIVQQAGGAVRVHSAKGRGTTFDVLLPAIEHASMAAQAPDDDVADAGEASRGSDDVGGRVVLVAEDDADVRRVVRRVLEMKGYTVLQAEHGEAALKLAAGHSGRIDLLLTDMVMPHLSGRELAERLLRLRPGTKVLFMSGHTEDETFLADLQASRVAFVGKPFTPSLLAARVEEVLGA